MTIAAAKVTAVAAEAAGPSTAVSRPEEKVRRLSPCCIAACVLAYRVLRFDGGLQEVGAHGSATLCAGTIWRCYRTLAALSSR